MHSVQFQFEHLIQSWKLLKQQGGVGADLKALLAAKCKALGSFLPKRGKQNEKNIFLNDMWQKYTCMMMINLNAGVNWEMI